jgi:hypothetical protein
MEKKAPVIQWRDIFAIVDDGTLTIADYRQLEKVVQKQATDNPKGLGCLVILPPGATPPPAEVRRYLNDMLGRLSIRCLAYVVEGTGFKGASARAALVGMGIFLKKPYPTMVEKDVKTAVGLLLEKIGGDERRAESDVAYQSIASGRQAR